MFRPNFEISPGERIPILYTILLLVPVFAGIFGLCACVASQPDPAREALDAMTVNRLVYNHDFAAAVCQTPHQLRDHTKDSVRSYLAYARSLALVSPEESEAVARCASRSQQYAIIEGHLVPARMAISVAAGLASSH